MYRTSPLKTGIVLPRLPSRTWLMEDVSPYLWPSS